MNAEVELQWFFSWADGDLGLHAMSLQMPTRGTGSTPVGPSDREIAAASRWRAIADVIHRLPHHDQRVLRAAHAPFSRALWTILHEHLGDAAAVVCALHGSDRVLDLANGARRHATKRARLAELRLEAETALARSRFAFWRLSADRHDALNVQKRRRLTEALASRLRGAA